MKRLLSVVVATWSVLACSDAPTGPAAKLPVIAVPALIVSDAVQPLVSGEAFQASVTEQSVYLSLPPGSLSDMITVQIRNKTTGTVAAVVELVGGGFDPVSIAATQGDELELLFTDSTGSTSVAYALVRERRPPVVVRTVPPRGRTDVVLSIRPMVVFSEPVDPGTLANGVRLLSGGAVVETAVSLSVGQPWVVELIPASELEPGTNYELSISQEVRDLSGDLLESSQAVTFSTQFPAGSVETFDRVTHSFLPGVQRYAMHANGRFTLQYRDNTGRILIGEYIGSYSRNGSVVTFDFDEPGWKATGTILGDTLTVEYNLTMSLSDFEHGVFVRSTPEPPRPATLYERVPRTSFFSFVQRYVLYEDGAFSLQYRNPASGRLFGEYTGSHSRNGPAVTFDFDGDDRWKATGTISGDTLTVEYNDVMILSDFDDGVFVRIPDAQSETLGAPRAIRPPLSVPPGEVARNP